MNPEPISTYRLQLRPEFGFEKAEEVIDYLAKLGISHLYCSPYLQAVSGSSHGYDVTDPTHVNNELGGDRQHARFCEKILESGLFQMIDLVPNHMAIAGKQNPWWWDVLKNGPSSFYAAYFDVDWEASEERFPNRVLLPVLGDHYGRVLEAKELKLSYQEGVFTLHYHDQVFPIDPSSLSELLKKAAYACGSELLAFLAESCARLPRPATTLRQSVERRHRDQEVLLNLLSRVCRELPSAKSAIDTQVSHINDDPNALDELLDMQNYRLAFWKVANRDLGYRRFFDIKDLAGLRIEEKEVFYATHALPISWVQKGWVQGLRIDHPDGLCDPAGYLHNLRKACNNVWIIVEKILEPGEKLPEQWPVEGTTGYDFLNLMNKLFIDSRGEEPLTKIYNEFTGEQIEYSIVVRTCKRLVLTDILASELNRLTTIFVSICEKHRRYRDYTRKELRDALCETAVCFPVYRSYVSPSEDALSKQDEQVIHEACEKARNEKADLDPELFSFLQEILLLKIPGSLEEELAERFQQLTGPAMAKGIEDTAFYRYLRLISLNEVGGDPGRFGVSLKEFHKTCLKTQEKYPCTLLATTTHDTKRSEDVRARLALLSEIPEQWSKTIKKWSAMNQQYRLGDFPDRNTEYLFYQTLVGAWPINNDRMKQFLQKAVREAKVHTSWTEQNKTYETAVYKFSDAVLADRNFLADFEAFTKNLIAPGRVNSLSQTLIKLTAPGVPDIYQGSELWDLRLVDPDNRTPVDFLLRRHLLEEMPGLSANEVLEKMDSGLPKLWIIQRALHLRKSKPLPFGPQGSYRPLFAEGKKADHAVAFVRGESVVSISPRLVMSLGKSWDNTILEFPKGNWQNVFTGEEMAGGKILLQKILHRFPVGLFAKNE